MVVKVSEETKLILQVTLRSVYPPSMKSICRLVRRLLVRVLRYERGDDRVTFEDSHCTSMCVSTVTTRQNSVM